MTSILAIVIGVLFAAGIYLMLRRTIVKLIIGLSLLSHAVNLLIFTTGGLTRAAPPLVPPDATQLTGAFADPLPQALVLTAIVISFGVTAFTLILFHRMYQVVGADDVDQIRTAEE